MEIGKATATVHLGPVHEYGTVPSGFQLDEQPRLGCWTSRQPLGTVPHSR